MTPNESPAATKKAAILVAGVHRSGTSALTRMLNFAGCTLPNTLMKPQRDNVAGFWESQAIMDLHQEILSSAGSSWDDWRTFPQDWYSSPVAENYRHRARDLIGTEYGESPLCVLKDPRICRLLDFWIGILHSLNIEPIVISPIRNPIDVALSLHARNDIDPFVGHLIWLRYVLDAELSSRTLKRTYLRYELLLSQPHSVIDRLARDLGIVWPRHSSPVAEMEGEAFLSPSLHHHRKGDADSQSYSRLSEWIRTSFTIFERWALGNQKESDASELDRIREALDDATPLFSRAVATGQEAAKSRIALSKELEASQGEALSCQEEIHSLSRDLEASWREVATCQSRIASLTAELENLRQEGPRDRKEVEVLRLDSTKRVAQIQTLSKQVARSQEYLSERAERIESLLEQLESLRADFIESGRRNRTLSKELDSAKGELVQLESLRADFVESERRNRTLSKELDSAKGELVQLESLRADFVESERRNRTLSKELDSAKGELVQLESLRADFVESGRRNRTLSKELDSAKGELVQLESLRADFVESGRRNRTLSKELDSAKGELVQLESLRADFVESGRRNRTLSKELDGAKDERLDREDRIKFLEAEVEGLRTKAAQEQERALSLMNQLEVARVDHVMAFAHRDLRFGLQSFEVNFLGHPEWAAHRVGEHSDSPVLVLRRNSQFVTQKLASDLKRGSVRISPSPRFCGFGPSVYSVHDPMSGKVLAALCSPGPWWAPRAVGVVENHSRPEVRGWLFDPSEPMRRRRVGIQFDGHFCGVVDACLRRADIARCKGTDGCHGFLWSVPEDLSVREGSIIDVFDADTGFALSGSPIRIEDGRALASRHGDG